MHSDTPRSGWFECSDELVNQLWHNINWGQRGNFISVPTDCPQRDERLGWLADAQVFMPTATLNMDVSAFFTKWGDDVLDAQSPEGAYSDVAPRLVIERDGAPAWADAGVIVPWVTWRRYGDLRLVERHWDAMERYLAYLQRHNPDLLWRSRRGNDYGDWLAVGAETPRGLLATAYWAYDAKLMAEMARGARTRGSVRALRGAACGDRRRVQPRVRRGRRASSRATPRPPTCWHCTWTCCPSSCAGVPRSGSSRTSSATTSTSRPASSASGCCARSSARWATATSRTGCCAPRRSRHGATRSATARRRSGSAGTAGRTRDGFQTPEMNSFNHYSLGSVGQWLYEYVAGIRAAAPGYARVLIAPEPGELEWARVVYESVRGPITSDWRREEDAFRLEVEIPPNVTATVVVPGGETAEVGPGRHVFTAAVSPVA